MLVLVLVSSCARESDSSRIHLAYVTNGVTSFWQIARVGAEHAAREFDVEVVGITKVLNERLSSGNLARMTKPSRLGKDQRLELCSAGFHGQAEDDRNKKTEHRRLSYRVHDFPGSL